MSDGIDFWKTIQNMIREEVEKARPVRGQRVYVEDDPLQTYFVPEHVDSDSEPQLVHNMNGIRPAYNGNNQLWGLPIGNGQYLYLGSDEFQTGGSPGGYGIALINGLSLQGGSTVSAGPKVWK